MSKLGGFVTLGEYPRVRHLQRALDLKAQIGSWAMPAYDTVSFALDGAVDGRTFFDRAEHREDAGPYDDLIL